MEKILIIMKKFKKSFKMMKILNIKIIINKVKMKKELGKINMIYDYKIYNIFINNLNKLKTFKFHLNIFLKYPV